MIRRAFLGLMAFDFLFAASSCGYLLDGPAVAVEYGCAATIAMVAVWRIVRAWELLVAAIRHRALRPSTIGALEADRLESEARARRQALFGRPDVAALDEYHRAALERRRAAKVAALNPTR